jgi:hypothetical protein
VQKAAGVAGEGWKLLNDALGETGDNGGAHPPRYGAPRQTSPF